MGCGQIKTMMVPLRLKHDDFITQWMPSKAKFFGALKNMKEHKSFLNIVSAKNLKHQLILERLQSKIARRLQLKRCCEHLIPQNTQKKDQHVGSLSIIPA